MEKATATSKRPAAGVVGIVLLALYLVVGAALIGTFKDVLNADGVSYLSIAYQYLRGDFSSAINGFWGPLISWSLVPFLAAGIDPLVAAKIVALAAGLLLLIGLRGLGLRLGLSPALNAAVLAASVPWTLYAAFCMITPDFLVLVFLVWYLRIMAAPDDRFTWKSAAAAGALGALAYFTKPIAFFFFLAHFSAWSVFRAIALRTWPERRKAALAWAAGLAAFFVLAGPWIGLLTRKYGHFTINNAGALNFAVVAPGSTGQPIFSDGFVPPPNPTAVSAWEDPSFVPRKPWSPLRSRQDLIYMAGLIKLNSGELLAAFQRFSPVGLLGLALLTVFALVRIRTRWKLLIIPLAVLLYSGGYLIFLVEDRYIWLDVFLLMFAAASLLAALFRLRPFRPAAVRVLLTAAVLATFMGLPFHFFTHIDRMSTTNRGTTPAQIREMSRILRDEFGLRGSIASDDYWNETMFLAFFNHYRYYGVAGRNETGEEIERSLRDLGVKYFFLWRDRDSRFAFLKDKYIDLTGGRIAGLRVFRLLPKSGS